MLLKQRKKTVHLLHRLKFWFFTQLERLDGIPFFIRIPLGGIFFALGVLFFYIPFINGLIFMVVGARMLGKKFSNKIFRFLANINRKSFVSVDDALLHTLKK